jgi:tetratricopeptide (TPR) repeat protein
MKRAHKIALAAALGVVFLGAASLATALFVCFWQLAEGTRLSHLGYERMMQKDYDGAIKNLTEASRNIVMGENRYWLYVNRGYAQFHRKRYDDAIKDFSRSIEIDPAPASPYEGRGQAWEQKKDIDKALADYDRAIERDANRGLAHLQRGTALYDRGEIDKALTDFHEVTRIWPNYAHGFAMRARCDLRQEDPDLERALAGFDAALTLEPWNASLYTERAKVYQRLGDGERAFFDTAQAQHLAEHVSPSKRSRSLGGSLRPNPKESLGVAPLPHLNAGNVVLQLSDLLKDFQSKTETGAYEEAIALCNKALILDLPPVAASYVTMMRGECFWIRAEYDKAGKDYDEAIKLNPKNALAYVQRGISLTERGELEDALKDYAEAIRIDPREYSAYCYRGFTFFYEGEFHDALTNFDKALEINAARPEAYLCRAELHIQRHAFDDAMADCAAAIRFHPDLPDAYAIRSFAYLRSGHASLAEQDLKTAHAYAKKEELFLHSSLAWLRSTAPDARLRNGSEALKEARRCGDMVHWGRPSAFDILATAEAEAGDFRKAVEHEEQALGMSIPPVLREEVEARLNLFRQHQPFRETVAN